MHYRYAASSAGNYDIGRSDNVECKLHAAVEQPANVVTTQAGSVTALL
jgi:hypothetical protein